MGFKTYTVSIVNNAFTIKSLVPLSSIKHSYFSNNDDVTFANEERIMTIPLTYLSDVQEVNHFLEMSANDFIEEPTGVSEQISQLLKKMGNVNKGKQATKFMQEASAPPWPSMQAPSTPPNVNIAPAATYTYSAYFAQGQIVVQSTIWGVFNVLRGRNSWLIPNAKINFNPEGTAFWADVNDNLAMHCVRTFINSKPGFFVNAQQVLDSLPTAVPTATIQVDPNYQPPPKAIAPPALPIQNTKVDDDDDDNEQFFEFDNDIFSTTGRISPAFDATLPKSTASSPGAESEYPDFLQMNNQKKLETIMNHKAWGADYNHDGFLFKDSNGLKQQIEENNWICFTTEKICNQPVVLPDSGKTIDLESLTDWRKTNNTDPFSRAPLPEIINTAKDMGVAINTFLTKRFNELEAAVGVKNKLTFNN